MSNNHLWGFSNSAINMTQFQGGTNPYQQQQRAPSSFAQAAASSTNIASSVPAVNNMSIPAPDSSDFPALGSQQQQQSSFGRSPRILPPGLPMQQQQQQQPNHKLDNNPPVSVGAGLANVFPPLSNSTQVQPLEQQIQQSQTQPQDRGQTQQPLREGENDATKPAGMEQFGLNGLLGVIRMEHNDQTTVAIGSDLNTMGLKMSSKESLSRTFASPWAETSRCEVEPPFRLPSCYTVDVVPPQNARVSNFSDETLFYIFYTMPRDIMQELAARELTSRNWRFHKELKMWLTKDLNSEPIQNTAQSERGVYIFFDPTSWENVKKEFILYYQSIV